MLQEKEEAQNTPTKTTATDAPSRIDTAFFDHDVPRRSPQSSPTVRPANPEEPTHIPFSKCI